MDDQLSTSAERIGVRVLLARGCGAAVSLMADISRQQAALERLALLEPCELSAEAKTETCRATRDLRSCGRAVRHVLSACGHACLCLECLQRSVSCPICRTPTGSFGQDKLRLFEELVDAGLIQKGAELAAESVDVGRLYSFFDVALNNNLVSLICHCILSITWNFAPH